MTVQMLMLFPERGTTNPTITSPSLASRDNNNHRPTSTRPRASKATAVTAHSVAETTHVNVDAVDKIPIIVMLVVVEMLLLVLIMLVMSEIRLVLLVLLMSQMLLVLSMQIEEEVGDDATAKLFEYCDPRPVDGEGSGTGEESLSKVSFGG